MTTGRGEPTAREARPAGETIPEPPAALLDAYLAALAPLGERIHGVYVYGSLALGAFDPRTSDIDLLVPTASALSAAEVAWLAAAHAALTRSNPSPAGCKPPTCRWTNSPTTRWSRPVRTTGTGD